MAMGFVAAKAKALGRLRDVSLDKAPNGGIDEAARPLVAVLNGSDKYVTTSTCAGRCVVYASPATGTGRWLLCSHDSVTGDDIRRSLASFSSKSRETASFKFEPPIAHVRCANLHAADALAALALRLGFRESGVTSLSSTAGPLVAIRTLGSAMDVPIGEWDDGSWLGTPPDAYLDYVAEIAADRLSHARRKLRSLVDAIPPLLKELTTTHQKKTQGAAAVEEDDDDEEEEATCVFVSKVAARRVKVALGRHFRKELLIRGGEEVAVPVSEEAAAAIERGDVLGDLDLADVLRVGRARLQRKHRGRRPHVVDFRRWSRLGPDALLVPEDIEGDWPKIAKAANVKRLFRDAEVCNDPTRSSQRRLLYPLDGETWVTIKEGGLSLSFDAVSTMFSFGNTTERLRHANFDCTGEVVVDLYAGIGYFALAYLKAGANHLHACEWAPKAVEALRLNLASNNFAENATVYAADNRVAAQTIGAIADRVSLGLTPTSRQGWPIACDVLSPRGGVLHVHENQKIMKNAFQQWGTDVAAEIQSLLEQRRPHEAPWSVACVYVSKVKSYAPHVFHLVADLRCLSSTTCQ